MKGRNLLYVSVVLALAVAFAGAVVAADVKKLDVKVGEEYYVCNCGEGCPCDTISSRTGQCGCGQDLVKAKVTKVEGDKAMFKAEKWAKEVEFDLVAKYTCACGPDCPCKTISQKPGKCGCGKELKPIGG
jgi:hypothetical protein